jgi:hypothetical protein
LLSLFQDKKNGIDIKHGPTTRMDLGNDLENLMLRPFYGPLAGHLGPGHVARLREVSRGVKLQVDHMRRGRTIKLNEPWFAGLPGTPAENLAELMGRLAELVASGAVIRELILPRVELDGTEPALLSAITPKLTKLSLQGNSVGGRGVFALHRALVSTFSLRSLTFLNLSANDNEEGSAQLARLLPQLLSLTHLALADCSMETEDAERLGPALQQCRRLTHVDLSGNFEDAGVDLLWPALPLMPGLAFLNLCNCAVGNGAALAAALAQCRALVTVKLENCSLDGDFAALNAVWPQLPALAFLLLSDNQAAAREMEGLADALPLCPALRQVCVHRNSLGVPQAVVALAQALPLCPWLETLDVRETVFDRAVLQWVALPAAHQQLLLAAWAPRPAAELWL